MRCWTVNFDNELENLTRIAWREVADNSQLVTSLVNSMRSRYQAVIEYDGYHTKY